MTTYRRYPRRPLTPPAELVDQLVKWRPKAQDGSRSGPQYGTVESFDADARCLTIRVALTPTPWSPASDRIVTIPLAQGPFAVV